MSNAILKLVVGSLVAALAVLLAPAFAGANTEVKPPGHDFALTLADGTSDFVTNNGTGSLLECEVSDGSGTLPSDTRNNNNAPGSVLAKVDHIEYDDCVGGPLPVTVAIAEPTEWSVSGLHLPHEPRRVDGEFDAVVAIAVPPEAVTISIPTPFGGCELTVGINGSGPLAQAVMGHFANGTNSTNDPSELIINDSQVFFEQTGGTCIGVNTNPPAQYFAHYEVLNTTDTNQAITIEQR